MAKESAGRLVLARNAAGVTRQPANRLYQRAGHLHERVIQAGHVIPAGTATLELKHHPASSEKTMHIIVQSLSVSNGDTACTTGTALHALVGLDAATADHERELATASTASEATWAHDTPGAHWQLGKGL